MGLYSGGLIIARIFASEIWGAYFWEGLFLEGLIIGILGYMVKVKKKVNSAILMAFLTCVDQTLFQCVRLQSMSQLGGAKPKFTFTDSPETHLLQQTPQPRKKVQYSCKVLH